MICFRFCFHDLFQISVAFIEATTQLKCSMNISFDNSQIKWFFLTGNDGNSLLIVFFTISSPSFMNMITTLQSHKDTVIIRDSIKMWRKFPIFTKWSPYPIPLLSLQPNFCLMSSIQNPQKIFTDYQTQTPSPIYLYIVKITNFCQIFMS